MEYSELIYKKIKGAAPFAYVMADGWLYFCDSDLPGLFRYHFEREVCEGVTLFDNKYVNKNFFKLVVYEDELWMLPFLDGKIVCYNMQTQEINYYSVPKDIIETRIPFIDMVFCEKKAFILPHGNNNFLIQVNIRTHQMEKLELIKTKNKNDEVFFSGAVQAGNAIYLAEEKSNFLILFNTDNGELEIVRANGFTLKDITLGVIGDKIYFFPWDVTRKLVIYHITKNTFYEEEYPIKNLPQGEECVVITYEGGFWILANKKKEIYRLDQGLEIRSVISILNFNKEEKIVYISGVVSEDRFFLHGHKGTPLIEVKDGVARIRDVSRDKSSLELYIELLNSDYEKCKHRVIESGVGQLIYENIMTDNFRV